MSGASNVAVKSYCTKCAGITNHAVLVETELESTPDNTPGMEIDFWREVHQVVSCNGCEHRSFRLTTVCSEDFDDEGLPAETATSYPGPPNKPRSDMLPIKPFPHLPKKPRRIYRETMEAFNAELYTLAAGGLRAIVEAICADRKIADGPVEVPDKNGGKKTVRKNNLQGKIAGLAEAELLASKQANVLHAHRFLGNDALHDLEMPEVDDLKLAISIVEHALEAIYELEHHGARLTKGRT